MSEIHAAESQNSFFKIALNLTIACLISGIIIAGTYAVTHPVAVRQAALLKEQSMKDLIQDADSFQPVPEKPEWFAAFKGGHKIGYIVPAESKGYGGKIKMLVAVTPEGKVIDYNVLAMNETPGLGDKGAKSPFRDQFAGKAGADLVVVKDQTKKNNIQALTGATITSRAVTKGVKEAVDQVTALTGGK